MNETFHLHGELRILMNQEGGRKLLHAFVQELLVDEGERVAVSKVANESTRSLGDCENEESSKTSK
jgi:hypothetical protein